MDESELLVIDTDNSDTEDPEKHIENNQQIIRNKSEEKLQDIAMETAVIQIHVK